MQKLNISNFDHFFLFSEIEKHLFPMSPQQFYEVFLGVLEVPVRANKVCLWRRSIWKESRGFWIIAVGGQAEHSRGFWIIAVVRQAEHL